jgi:superfamily I DNA/RNA helicase
MGASIPNDWAEFNEVAFDLTAEAIGQIDEFKPYDFLAVDEGQDLMTQSFVDVLGLLLKGSMESGDWLVCYDPQQAIYMANYEKEVLDRLVSIGVPLNLTKNCRNTRNVAAYVSGLSGTEAGSLVNIDGPKVEIEYYEDLKELLRRLKSIVNRSITELLDAGLNVSDVVILSPRTDVLESLAETSGLFVRSMQKYSVTPDPQLICWSTLHSFKGLEAPEIILVGFDSIKSDMEKLQLYVGGSRARSRLCLLLPESASEEVGRALPRIYELLNH